MSIPLINEVNKNDINTSIIAIKKNLERINTLLGLNNTEEIDTSIFATKEELEALETALQPVDEVTLNNMQSVTSNAVAKAIGLLDEETISGTHFGAIRYSKTFVIPTVTVTPNSGISIANNFEIDVNKAVGFEGFMVSSNLVSSCTFYIQNFYGYNQLCMVTPHSGTFAVVARVYYIK